VRANIAAQTSQSAAGGVQQRLNHPLAAAAVALSIRALRAGVARSNVVAGPQSGCASRSRLLPEVHKSYAKYLSGHITGPVIE
jgi:hypothetical protein